MKYDFIYDSSNMSDERNLEFKSFISLHILFEKENICLEVDVYGNAIFTDVNGIELYRDKANGQGRYFYEVYCSVKDGAVSVRFPIQEVIDHYPNCDGEYDRYSYITRANVVIDYKL
jgi:hypothetical protein